MPRNKIQSNGSVQELLVEAPGAGMIYNEAADSRTIPAEAWTDGRNARFVASGTKVRKADSYDQYDTTGQHVRQLMRHIALDGVQQLVRVTLTTATKGVPSTLMGALPVAGTADDVVTWDQFADLLIWTDKKSVPQKWDGIAAAHSNLGGTPPKAKIVRVFKSQVMFFNINDGVNDVPYRMVHSAPGQPEVYVGGGAGDLDLLDTPGGIIAAERQGDSMVAFKENALYRLVYTGTPDGWIPELIESADEDGTVSARSVIRVGPYLFYRGGRNFYRLGSYPEPIGDAIEPAFRSLADFTKRHLWFAYVRPEWNEIHWAVTSPLATTQCDIAFSYNYLTGRWNPPHEYNPGTSFLRIRLPGAVDTWNGGTSETWDGGLSVSWDDPALALGAHLSLFSQQDGLLQSYRGPEVSSTNAFTAYVESKIHHLGGLRGARVIEAPIIARGTGGLELQIRAWDDERQSTPPFSSRGIFDLGPSNRKPWLDVRTWGRLQQMRYQNAQPADDFELELYGLRFIPGSNR